MATRCQYVLSAVLSRSVGPVVDGSVSGARCMSRLTATKASKHVDEAKRWSDKQHEEWVNRRFGSLKKSWTNGNTNDKSDAKSDAIKKSQ